MKEDLALLATVPVAYPLEEFVEIALQYLANPPALPHSSAERNVLPFPRCTKFDASVQKWTWILSADSPAHALFDSAEQIFYFVVTRKHLTPSANHVITAPKALTVQQKCRVTIQPTSEAGVAHFHEYVL